MKLTSSQEADIWQVYDTWLSAYLNADVTTYDSFLDDDYHFIGSTNNEEFLKRTDATMFFEQTGEQFAGIMDLRNERKILEVFDTSIFITHFCDVWFINDDDRTYYGRFRLSSVMKEKNEGWRFIYQHFSMPDSKSDEGESIGFDKVNAENIELKEAIKRRTIELENKNRELEIESALERVRSASMAMQHPDDLDNVNKELLTQLQKLQIDGLSGVSIWLIDDEGLVTAWDLSSPGNMGDPNSAMVRYDSKKFDILGEPWRMLQNSDDDYFVLDYSAEKLQKAIKEWAQVDQEVADGFRNALLNGSLKHQWNPIARHSNGILSIDLVKPPADDTKEIVTKMAGAFSLAYRRFLDLQKAEAQAREAQIEAALEKVRSRTMAMQSSDELTEAATEMFSKIEDLGLNPWSCGFNIFNDDKTVISQWVSTGDGRPIEPFDTPATQGIFKRIVEQSENDEPLYIEKMEGKKLKDTYKYMASLPTLDKIFEELDAAGIELPKKQVDHAAYFKHGYLMFITYEETPEFHSIFKRFANVFEQTYTRFLDLQKAEAQAREAKIETALEKIRSRTMAMQKGEELQEVAVLLYKELIALGVTNFVTCGYVEVNEDIRRQHTWVTAPGGDTMGLFHLPLTGDDTFDARYAAWKNQQPIFHQSIAGQVRINHLEYAITTFNSKEAEEMVRSQFPDPTVFYCFNFPHGYLHTVGGSLLTNDEELLLARFTKVFAQTYTRFLDLKRAEAQAREAQIENALEKVRSRSMGMQSSEELPEVANLMFLEIQNLGINAFSCGYCILEEDRRSSMCIMSTEGTIQKPFLLPHVGEPSFEEWDDFVHSDRTFFTQELAGKSIESHYDFMTSLPQLQPVYQDLKDAGLSLPTYQINHLAKFSAGFLLFITYEPVPEAHDIFKRFTAVFNQTYTRFLDLKKSEKRAREAEVDLSLERVRSQVTAMQASSDLFDIVVNMRKEFVSLGYDADYFWHMRWLPHVYEMSMTSEDGNRLGMVINVPKFVHDQIPGLAEWEKGSDPTYVLALNAEEAWDYIDNMNKHGDYEVVDPNAPSREDIEHIGGLTFIIARTTHGEVGYSLPGVVPKPPTDALDTLVSFAGVFDLAYKRFEDLKAAEQQSLLILEERDRLEVALKELYATQDQLVQQEKLASLGQLTAGIAHEIKNPLNFVNNFSDLSLELVEEVRDEVRRMTADGGPEDSPLEGSAEAERRRGVSDEATDDTIDPDLILEILDDIEANLKTIHKHGSRADSIVKSMLQHSRGGDGKMEPTNLNGLIKEFVTLTFHGMRAGKDPINVDINFDLDDSLDEVPLIAEDFSRVVINLCNNAFDAMREKVNKHEDFNPELTVKTFSSNGNVTIEIEDNGPGIPDDMRDKIMQPFFTTKKGTQGTGLGLSITNDIIKAHGGKLLIDTNFNQGSTFKVVL